MLGRTGRRAVIIGALVALPLSGAGVVYVSQADAVSSEPNEDEPSWDCRVHGNGVCGDSIDTDECGPIGNPLGCPTWEAP